MGEIEPPKFAPKIEVNSQKIKLPAAQEEVQPKKEIAKPEVKRAEKPISNKSDAPISFNLKTIFDKVEEEKAVIENRENLPKEKFTETQFLSVWSEFLENLKSQKQIPAYNALHTAKITLENELKINFEFSSLSLSSEFDLQRDALMRLMRQKLNNHHIEFEVQISKSEETKTYIKTKKDIFTEMAEKNPILLKMKNEFGLDFNSND